MILFFKCRILRPLKKLQLRYFKYTTKILFEPKILCFLHIKKVIIQLIPYPTAFVKLSDLALRFWMLLSLICTYLHIYIRK